MARRQNDETDDLRFAGVERQRPRFRPLLEEHQLTEKIFAEVRSLLEEKKRLLK